MQRTLGKTILSRLLVALLSVTLVFTMMPLGNMGISHAAQTGTLQTQTPVLVVTGEGVIGGSAYSTDNVSSEKSYSLDELKQMATDKEIVFSAKKQRSPFTKSQHKVKGVDLASLVSNLSSREERISIIASDGYVSTFKKGAAYQNVAENVGGQGSIGKDLDYGKLDNITPAPGFDQTRYWYEDFVEAKATPVPAVIAWNYEENEGADSGAPESAGTKDQNLKFFVGQLGGEGYDGIEDMNGPLLNGGSKAAVNRVLVGKPLIETAVTIGDQAYSRSDILLMPYAEKTYEYTNQKGDQIDTGRGVPMSVLLDGYADEDIVTFSTVDGYPVGNGEGMTVGDLIAGDYMLAYEINGKGIYSTAKNDESQYGFFSLMGNGFNPAKMINKISVTSSSGIDFSKSPYKHITNGGLSGKTPYNIDAITGATLTIEGPGVEASVPLSVKDMEGRNAGAFRGVYTDTRDGKEVKRTYEGIDLYYLLYNMKSGDNGIRLTDEAMNVQLKNRNRKTIAELSLDQIVEMHQDGRPAIVAYGTAFEDGSSARPFVFDGGAGANGDLGNEDGCLKFVYDKQKYKGNDKYTKFGNMAYIYVEREKTPGFKHDKSPYNTARNSQYVLTVTGDAIGREVNYKVADLEKLVEYDSNGNVKDNGYGWRSEYSMANSSYWYVNSYEGVKLWSLLRHSGIKESKASDENTKVSFRSTDNYGGFDVFSLKQVANPDSFGFYEKNANDNNDGTYEANENIRQGDDVTTGDKLSVGYPVLVAYGVNEYPFVIHRDLKGYLSGLSNDGGPLRIISGKMNYSHANGSNQAKLLDKIVVGEDKYHYSTHFYQPTGSAYKSLKGKKLKVIIKNGTTKKTKTYYVRDLEKLLYGGKLSAAQLKEAKVKDFYETGKKGKYVSDLYEGVDLAYFLKEVVLLQGSQGKVTFKSGKKKLTVDLKKALKTTNGYNAKTKLNGLSPVIAFAKNGYPLVKTTKSKGYKKTGKLTKVSNSSKEATSYTIKNSGGPLQVIFPRASKKAKVIGGTLASVDTIVINLKPDKYAHTSKPYNKLGKRKLTVTGDGTRLTKAKTFTVNNLEGKQSIIQTADYSIRSKSGKVTKLRYRGLNLYEFLKSTDVGLKTNADKVLIYTSKRPKKPYEFALSDIMKSDYYSAVTGKKNLPVMLAFGSASVKNKSKLTGKPLVLTSKSKGYVKKYKNSGGPLKLVVGQTGKKDVNSTKILGNVIKIEVTAGGMTSWNHSSSEVFKTYLDQTLELKVVGKDGTEQTKTLTIKELEEMKDIISQEKIYAVQENTWEGLNFWQLIQKEFAGVPGIDDPITINVKALDGYSVDAVEKAGLDGLKNGIKDGDNRIPVMLAYAVDGYPLAAGGKSTPLGVGYDSTVDNKGGPLRLMVHNSQGACIMEVTSITVTVNGSVPTAKASQDLLAKAKDGLEKAGTSLKDALMPAEAYGAEKQHKFTVYGGEDNQGGLPWAGAWGTSVDSDGTLWVGTFGAGVAYLNKGSDQFVTLDTTTEPALRDGNALAVCADGQGGVWIGQGSSPAAGNGAAYLKDGKLTYYTAEDGTVAHDFVQEVKIDKDGNVWFGTAKGLTKYDPEAGTWQSWGKSGGDGIEKVDFPAESVDNIELDPVNGGLWCGFYMDANENGSYTGGFAYFKDDHVVKSYQYTSRKDGSTDNYRFGDVWVRDIAVQSDGSVWAIASGNLSGMDNEGGTLLRVSAPGKEAKEYKGFNLVGKTYLKGTTNQNVNPELRMVTFDPKGGMWLGTSADGLLYVADPTIRNGKLQVAAQFNSEKGNWPKSFDSIYSLDFFGDTVYAGTLNGLMSYDFSSGYPSYNPLKGKKPSLTSAKATKGKVTLKWKKLTGASGYYIYRATKKKGTYKKIKTVKNVKSVKLSVKKLKKGKRYYFKIKAYKTVDGKRVTSSFSNYKSVKIKK